MGVNRIFILGSVCSEPQFIYVNESEVVVEFQVNTPCYERGIKEECDVINVVMFGAPAIIAEKFIEKESMLFFSGRLRSSTSKIPVGFSKKIIVSGIDVIRIIAI